jgi:hypothetical protein
MRKERYDMKHLKIAGLCLVSLLAVGMALTGTAQARWEQCTKGVANSEPPTKWTSNQCSAASKAGEWNWREVSSTEEVRIKGSIKMVDTKTPAGTSEVECSSEAVGSVGPGQVARITEIKTSAAQCRAIKVCENVEASEARNLPWQVEVYDTEGRTLSKYMGTGHGETGWKITCKEPILGSVTDECVVETGKPESARLENEASGTELLVLATPQQLTKQKCTQGGAKSGEITGKTAILSANGSALRVS